MERDLSGCDHCHRNGCRDMGNNIWKVTNISYSSIPESSFLNNSYPPNSPALGMGTHPKCVHTPIKISHSGFCTRWSSVCGSLSCPTSTLFAYDRFQWKMTTPMKIQSNSYIPKTLTCSMMSEVRCQMNSGFPRHWNVWCLPSGISFKLTSTLAKANTSADGLIVPKNLVTKFFAMYVEPTPKAERKRTNKKSI